MIQQANPAEEDAVALDRWADDGGFIPPDSA
jgi:hypothetical protein